MTSHLHKTHKMQSLDHGIFGPFKNFYNNGMNNWMISPDIISVIINIIFML